MLSRIIPMLAFLAFSLGAASNSMSAQAFSDLVETMRGFQENRFVPTAVELDVFSAVGAGATAAQVFKKLDTNARATETLLNTVAALGALTKKDATFQKTPETARYLVAGSPDDMHPALLHTVHMFGSRSTLTDCVRAGTAVQPPGIEQQDPQWTVRGPEGVNPTPWDEGAARVAMLVADSGSCVSNPSICIDFKGLRSMGR